MSEKKGFQEDWDPESGEPEIIGDEARREHGVEITADQIQKNYEEAADKIENDPQASRESVEANKGILEAAKDYLMEIIKDHPGSVLVAGCLVYATGIAVGYSPSMKILEAGLGAGIETITFHDIMQILLGGQIMVLGEDLFKKGREYWNEKHGNPLFSLSVLGREYSI
jgi:hypothetical protein